MIKQSIKVLFLFTLFAFIITSCTDEGGGTILDQKPVVSFLSGSAGNADVKPNDVLKILISGKKGSADLNAIEVREDGVKMAFDRFKINGNAAPANPVLIVGADRQGFASYEIAIQNFPKVGERTIEIILIDQSNNISTITKLVKVGATVGVSKYNGPPSLNASPNTLNSFSFDYTKTDGKLTSIEVKENDVTVDKARCSFDNVDFTANPHPVTGALADGFKDKKLIIRTPTAIGTYNYKVIFKDEYGLTTEQTFSIKVASAITFSANGILLNQAGPAGTGGLDLDNATGTGSGDPNAEIRDMGINSGPVATNWIQQIAGVNGTELARFSIGTELAANWTLSSVSSAEEIKDLYPKGKPLGTNKVVTGDVFVAKKGEKYYLFQIAEVFVTTGDNEDKYSIDIKW